MVAFKANQSPNFSSFSLIDERYRPVWLLANCTSAWERNYVLSGRIFAKHWKIMK